jgi:hypothetical protein
MALVEIVRELWQRKLQVGIVVALAIVAAIFSAYRFTSHGLEKRSLTVAAASSQILVDSTDSTLVTGAEAGELDALATRAKIYGQYLSSLDAREEIAKRVGIPAASISTSGPYSPATGQQEYASQPSGERADELLQEGAGNRLVFTAQEGVPILTVSAQAATTDRAVALAGASFQTLKEYVDNLRASGKPVRQGVTVRQLGAPEGGTLGGSNNVILMFLAFILVMGLGCAVILVLPTFVARWRALNKLDRPKPSAAPIQSVHDPDPFDPRLAGEDAEDPVAPHATTHLR